MLVSELIQGLQFLDQDKPIFVEGYEGGYDIPKIPLLKQTQRMVFKPEAYCGDYQYCWGSEVTPGEFTGYVLGR